MTSGPAARPPTDVTPGAAGRQAALYTPEAVRIDLPLADVGSRALAILIDLFCMGTLLYLVLVVGVAAAGVGTAAVGGDSGWPILVVILLLNFLVLWGYPAGSEALFGGRTAGKAAMGLRVVTTEGAPIRFRHAAVRGLMAFVDFYLLLGVPALVTALCTRHGQRLGDLAAGTVIIRDRTGVAAPAVTFTVPPALAGYAGTLDVRGLTPADYAVIRRFLLRAGSLEAAHRDRIARLLATTMALRMGHTPPPGTHPEALLLCAAALVQRRTPSAPPAWSPAPAATGSQHAPAQDAPAQQAPAPAAPVQPPPGPGPGGFAPPA